MPPALSLFLRDDGTLELQPRAAAPRLAGAFARSTGEGFLDALIHGLPLASPPALVALYEHARHVAAEWLKSVRGGNSEPSRYLPSPEEAAAWLGALPPVPGAPIGAERLQAWMRDFMDCLFRHAQREGKDPAEWLSGLGEGWSRLGRLCFHLAENGNDRTGRQPFAFLATFVHQVGSDGKSRHMPLGLALRAYENDRPSLLALLKPLREVAAESPFLAALADSGNIYRPLAWSAREAYDFLQTAPLLQRAHIDLRMVDLWKNQPPRIQLEITADTPSTSEKTPSLQLHSLLHFSAAASMGAYHLTEEELRALMEGDAGLVRFRGEWVQIDREQLRRLMEEWRHALRMHAQGIPLLAGLRYLLGGAKKALPGLPATPEKSEGIVTVRLGKRVANALAHLGRHTPELRLSPALDACLRGYQREGARFLLGVTEAGFGACLADDMGLGKTVQVIAWLSHLRATGMLANCGALIVTPASLLANWQEELLRFAPELDCLVLHPDVLDGETLSGLYRRPERLLARCHVGLTTYGIASRARALAQVPLPALVLDEAQAIKNASSQRSSAIRALKAERRVALTGTPLENSARELWSLGDFLNPGLLGAQSEFASFLAGLGSNYEPLRRLIQPFMLRRMKSDPGIAPELPAKTEAVCYCLLTPEQATLYHREVESLRAVIHEPDPATRLALILPVLTRLKQICNHPAQYLGTGYFDPAASGKMVRLGHLARQIAEEGSSTLVFTQYRSMIEPLHDLLATIFGSPGLTLHGGTPLAERREAVRKFQAPGGPRFFILSLHAAGTGLTLTRATHVIHFDRWWNPAVENQASDRAYRIGQQRPVWIHPFVCRGTLEENIHRMLAGKRDLAEQLLRPGPERQLLALTPEEWIDLVSGSPMRA